MLLAGAAVAVGDTFVAAGALVELGVGDAFVAVGAFVELGVGDTFVAVGDFVELDVGDTFVAVGTFVELGVGDTFVAVGATVDVFVGPLVDAVIVAVGATSVGVAVGGNAVFVGATVGAGTVLVGGIAVGALVASTTGEGITVGAGALPQATKLSDHTHTIPRKSLTYFDVFMMYADLQNNYIIDSSFACIKEILDYAKDDIAMVIGLTNGTLCARVRSPCVISS